jgi:hypothetical protein
MLVGVVADPVFGPVVACGGGGVTVELQRDVAVRVAPITDVDADEMVRSLATFPLLDGFRGRRRPTWTRSCRRSSGWVHSPTRIPRSRRWTATPSCCPSEPACPRRSTVRDADTDHAAPDAVRQSFRYG